MTKRVWILFAVTSLAASMGFVVAQGVSQQKEYGVEIRPAGPGAVTLITTVPIDDKRLAQLGLDRMLKSSDVRRMITTLSFVGAAHGGLVVGTGLGYKCDSDDNKCRCDPTHPLDCVDILTECSGPLGPEGEPEKICTPQDKKPCVCKWH